jgi:cystathionine beta-lyase/cystathionine gamma-synthase
MPHRIDTSLIHAGEPRILGSITVPVFQTAMYQFGGESSYHDLKYIRLNNTPNHAALHAKIAALEGTESALVTASGMAAISTALLTVLEPGDHLLVQTCLYGGTHDLVAQDFARLGITSDAIDSADPGSWEKKLRKETKAIYVETISNPLVQVSDVPAVARFAKRHGLVSLVDNTFASPVNLRPAACGIDLVLHSCTKYLNGHSDIVAGAVAGSEAMIEKVRHKLNHLGGTLDPHACFLLHRGMKTLALRVRHQNASGMRIAKFLEEHAAVAKVNYPGLESHAQHRLARGMLAGFGGMLSFEIEGGVDAAARFLERLTIPISAPSLGSVESLVTRPATTSHVGLPPDERRKIGISDSLVRLSIGIEDPEDLIEDLGRALKR